MKNSILFILLAFMLFSCSKKVEVQGKITGGSPLERIEFIEASGVGTLPLANLGISKTGEFSGEFTAPKDGMYMMTYAGRQAYVFLKGGQKLEFTANAATFPEGIKYTGETQKDNEFLKQTQENIAKYAGKINVGTLLQKNEADFIKEVKKIKTDLFSGIDEVAKGLDADSDVVNFKKDELSISILGLLSQYEQNHGAATQNLKYKASPALTDYINEFKKDNDKLVRNHPVYRNYLLSTLSQDFQIFSSKNAAKNAKASDSELFAEFLETRKDISQLTKDYLLAFVIGQYDISQDLQPAKTESISKLIEGKIKDNTVKSDLKKVLYVITGPKKGEELPAGKLEKQDGSSFQFSETKGKPTLVMFYASWNPYISEAAIPVLREVTNFYKSKMNFVYVNFDDTKEQFVKTSGAMFKGIPGTNVYATNGLQSDFADKLGIYGFKLPHYVVLDKDGKIASQLIYNLGDAEAVGILDKLTGLKAPTVAPEAHLQNDLVAPQPAK